METWLLLALVVAVGVDLPLVLLLPAILSLVLGTDALPAQWLSLASPGPAVLGGILFLAGWAATRAPGPRWMWEGLHAMAALPAAALLGYMFRPADPWLPVAGLLALAVLVAGSLQAGRLGARLLDRVLPDRPRSPGPALRDAAEDLAVVGLVLLLLLAPVLAGPVALMGLAAFTVLGRPSLRAASFLPVLIRGILRHLTDPEDGWTGSDALPGWILAGESREPGPAVDDPSGAGRSSVARGARGTRAGLAGGRELGTFRRGWLLLNGERPLFVYRTLARSWEVPLAPATDAPPPPGGSPPWGTVVPVDPGEGFGALLLPLDAPSDAEARL